MNSRVPPRLWRGSRTMLGSPRSESPIVHRLEGFQRNLSSLSNFREGFGSWIHLPKLLGVGGSLSFLSLVRLESFIVSLEHFLITRLNFPESCKPPEIFEGCVDLTFGFTQFPDLLGDGCIAERHLTFCRDILPPLLYREIGGCPTSRAPS